MTESTPYVGATEDSRNRHVRELGAFLLTVPDCATDTDVIVQECGPNRLNCAACERNPRNQN